MQVEQVSFWRRNWKLLINLATLVALAALIFAIRKDLVETFQNLWQVNAWALLLMIPIQALNYDAQARIYKGVFAAEGTKVTYRRLMRATVELNFVNNVFPSGGVAGITYFGIRMRGENVSAAKATAAHMMKLILLFISFELLIVIGVVALATQGQMNNLILLIAGSLVTSLIILTVGLGFIIGSKKRIAGFFAYVSMWVNKIIHLFKRSNPEVIKIDRVRALFEEMHEYYVRFSRDWRKLSWPLFWAFMANFWEVMTIFVVYIAFGDVVNIGAIILAYAIANAAGFVSVLPGGIGIYEGLMTVVLSASGVPSRLSIPVTVMYRVLSTLIQVPIGYIAYQKYLDNVKPSVKKQIEKLEDGETND